MGEATFTFRVADDLKASFAMLAKARDLSAAQMLRAMMRDAVARQQQDEAAHDAWFRGEVEQAVREADDPNVPRIPNATVEQDWQRQRDELSARAAI